MIRWPSSLPSPDSAGHERRPRPAVHFEPTAVGPGKRRPASTLDQDEVTFRFTLTTAQVSTFRSWWVSSTGRGVKPFLMTDPLLGGTRVWFFDGADDGTQWQIGPPRGGRVELVVHLLLQAEEYPQT